MTKLINKKYWYLPQDQDKTHSFFELILIDSESIGITEKFDRTNPEKMIFKKIAISKYSLSYFAFFKQNFQLRFQKWFISWWSRVGSHPVIFLDLVNEAYEYFVNNFNQQNKDILYSLIFVSQFQLPWIFMIELAVRHFDEVPTLTRIAKIKWWKNRNLANAHKSAIQKWFTKHPIYFKEQKQQQFQSAIATASTSQEMLSLMAELQKKILDEQEETPTNSQSVSTEEANQEASFNLEETEENFFGL
ncbi:hypothetical protein CDL12_09444 [Handroanthus impetiginosus]|uniref:Uncharacterized protein n=1 Tax=Handroanthus impetiginosus TaxID=429701 RepID=A0A2G9HK41_9LAMI|nr:hypothetical protein CDL12_09444 [Handroanthus impetiginosus]